MQRTWRLILGLIHELAAYENAPKEVTNTVSKLIADGFGTNPVFTCNVAVANGQIIGFTLCYISYSTWKGRCLYLEDFIVTEKWRRTGVGKQLFDQVYKEAEQMGAARLEWQVLNWNKPAIAFYKKHKALLDETWVNCKFVFKTA